MYFILLLCIYNFFHERIASLAVNLVMDRIANRPRGFAFLRYATEEESQKAIEGMHGKVYSEHLSLSKVFLHMILHFQIFLHESVDTR